jgi:ArsR family transcriptional regulator, arsenate/arsenite/antimonite-responsive transcriptional repressor
MIIALSGWLSLSRLFRGNELTDWATARRVISVAPRRISTWPTPVFLLLQKYREKEHLMPKKQNLEEVTRFADMFSAMGTESRLRIMQLLLSAHADGMVVGEIGDELEIPSSTLLHHLEKLKNEDLVNVRREGTFLWYSANTISQKTARIFVRRMLHPQQGHWAGEDFLHLQVTKGT